MCKISFSIIFLPIFIVQFSSTLLPLFMNEVKFWKMQLKFNLNSQIICLKTAQMIVGNSGDTFWWRWLISYFCQKAKRHFISSTTIICINKMSFQNYSRISLIRQLSGSLKYRLSNIKTKNVGQQFFVMDTFQRKKISCTTI